MATAWFLRRLHSKTPFLCMAYSRPAFEYHVTVATHLPAIHENSSIEYLKEFSQIDKFFKSAGCDLSRRRTLERGGVVGRTRRRRCGISERGQCRISIRAGRWVYFMRALSVTGSGVSQKRPSPPPPLPPPPLAPLGDI